MNAEIPVRVLISGGRGPGGLQSFAEALGSGFDTLGIPSAILSPRRMLSSVSDLRDRRVLKILSTTAALAAPFARRTLCVAHGFPRTDAQGWLKLAGIVLSFQTAARWSRVVAVSHYSAIHLRAIFGLPVQAVIHNPLRAPFLMPPSTTILRNCISFVGRLHPVKRIDKLLPALREVLDLEPDLEVVIAGDGPERTKLETLARGHSRICFVGSLGAEAICDLLQRTRVFVSACETEALGISYLEALSQGCVLAMPACGGGLEIAHELIGSAIQLFPLGLDSPGILATLRRALEASPAAFSCAEYEPAHIASLYLELDRVGESQFAVQPNAIVQE